MNNPEREPEGFIEKDRSRRDRKGPKRDGGKKIHRVGTASDNWRFDPTRYDEDDELYDEDQE